MDLFYRESRVEQIFSSKLNLALIAGGTGLVVAFGAVLVYFRLSQTKGPFRLAVSVTESDETSGTRVVSMLNMEQQDPAENALMNNPDFSDECSRLRRPSIGSGPCSTTTQSKDAPNDPLSSQNDVAKCLDKKLVMEETNEV